jgi:hypothetical protein
MYKMAPDVVIFAPKPLIPSSHKTPSAHVEINASTDRFVIVPLAISALQTGRPAITQHSPRWEKPPRAETHNVVKPL